MSEVMTQSSHSEDRFPIAPRLLVGNDLAHTVMSYVYGLSHHIENPRGDIHHTKGMLKSLVSCSWIDQIAESKLMNVPQPLKWSRINHLPLIGPNRDERMDRVTKFVSIFHRPPPIRAQY